jgi:tRNA (guanine37-N1)-methyltransferase
MIDAVTRLLPHVLGNAESSEDETTFSLNNEKIEVNGEHPQYTSPAEFSYTDEHGVVVTAIVPEILRSGHHANIKKENRSQRVKKLLTIE